MLVFPGFFCFKQFFPVLKIGILLDVLDLSGTTLNVKIFKLCFPGIGTEDFFSYMV